MVSNIATIGERIEIVNRLHEKEIAIMASKASDYSGDEDCNRNIKACERMGLCSAETGVMIRLLDKFNRLATLVDGRKAKVKDESILDTIQDARNYLAILYHLIEDKNKEANADNKKG